jgi:hypothetical protein
MDTFDPNEEELGDLLRSAGKVAPSAGFTQRMMARIDAAPVPEPALGRIWPKARGRKVLLVLLLVFLSNIGAFLLLLPEASNYSLAVPWHWIVSPIMDLLANPVTLMALLTMALTVWILVYLNRKVWQMGTAVG